MDTNVIQKRLNALAKAMMAKGLRNPDAKFNLRANVEPQVYLTWDNIKVKYNNHYEFFNDADITAMLAKADAFVASLPSPDEARMNEFMTALGSVIDLGRENNIEVEFVNPLIATMKRLSENVLTDQRVAS
ncbi:hypothetical protein J1C56_01820 [Aminobacter anthyllidis]|uniref:Uncharacterized protein n=2 Tax=Aminobacter TaxID=31988 RepID=A0A9X1D1U6_9HYPH|nr:MULTISPECIES: hypothetical protein [Aminobacter]MBB6353524.1 crotonobetainyl-CoA:carnitine CoA-transferase CaiB-like acyl-CoA transferase [Aminobacter aganoensis]MBT1154322.1 hypothetical protein [Aminobacter anthyllidis]